MRSRLVSHGDEDARMTALMLRVWRMQMLATVRSRQAGRSRMIEIGTDRLIVEESLSVATPR